MTTAKYTTKHGVVLYRPVLTLREAEHLMISDDLSGFCLACGEDGRCEPDCEKGHCESCGKPMLYGIEQLILRGIALVDDTGPKARAGFGGHDGLD